MLFRFIKVDKYLLFFYLRLDNFHIVVTVVDTCWWWHHVWWYKAGFSKPSRVTGFGTYQTIPAKNWYGLALENGLGSWTIQNHPNRTSMVWYRIGAFRSVQFSSARLGPGSSLVQVWQCSHVEGRFFSFLSKSVHVSIRYGTISYHIDRWSVRVLVPVQQSLWSIKEHHEALKHLTHPRT